jgi:hypothetical protein
MPFEWLRLALLQVERAGIAEYEVIQVLASDRRWPRPATSDIGDLLTIWGRTKRGDGLIVAIRSRGRFDYDIVGARRMSDSEVREFEVWEGSQ